MPRRLSWKPINFDRWISLGCAAAGNEIAVADPMLGAVSRMSLAWDRLGYDLDRLFLPSGPEGTHAYHHFHSPADPEERQAVVEACALDYETALVYLEIALQMTTRLVSAAASWPLQNWTTLVKAAERGDPGIATDAKDTILYLARTALYARHKAVIHPHEHLSIVSFDNLGNLSFRRMVESPEPGLLAELDALLRDVRPEIKESVKVGIDISPDLALTWIGAAAAGLKEADRLNYLREHLGYTLPGPYELAPAVDAMIDTFIVALPPDDFRSVALARVLIAAPTPAEDIPAPKEPDDAAPVAALFDEAMSAGRVGDHEKAADGFRRVLELDPEQAPARFGLAQALINLGRPAEAVEHLHSALAVGLTMAEVREKLTLAHFNAAALAFEDGRFDVAVAGYRRVCELDPKDREARARLAEALVRAGRVDAALLQAAILDRDPDNRTHARAQLAIGTALMAAGHFHQAKTRMDRALELQPGSKIANQNLLEIARALSGSGSHPALASD